MRHSGPVTWITALPVSLAGILAGILVTTLALLALNGQLRRNRWAGIRTRATMSSDQAFAAANQAGAPLMLAGGLAAILGGLLALILGITVSGPAGLIVGIVAVLLMGILSVAGGIVGTRAARRGD